MPHRAIETLWELHRGLDRVAGQIVPFDDGTVLFELVSAGHALSSTHHPHRIAALTLGAQWQADYVKNGWRLVTSDRGAA